MGPRAGDQRERNGMHLAPVAGVSGKPRAPVQVARALVEGGADPDARDSMARGPSPASPSPCSRGISGADLVNAARVGHRAGWRCTTACRKVSQRALCSYSTQGRTALHHCMPQGFSACVVLLLNAGADHVPPTAPIPAEQWTPAHLPRPLRVCAPRCLRFVSPVAGVPGARTRRWIPTRGAAPGRARSPRPLPVRPHQPRGQRGVLSCAA
jgi:hypothetical protein